MNPPALNILPLLPELIVLAVALGILSADWLMPAGASRRILGNVAIFGLVIALGILLGDKWGWLAHQWGWTAQSYSAAGPLDGIFYYGTFIADNLAWVFRVALLIASGLAVLLSLDYVDDNIQDPAEFYSLLLLAILGALLVTTAGDMISLYLALELTSVTAFVLAGFRKDRQRSSEAALKYLLVGALASAVMLYGMSLVMGYTGHTNLGSIFEVLARKKPDTILVLGILFILAGVSYKIAAFPFHMWVPDVYEGSPIPVTAFLSVVSKIAGFVAVIRIVQTFAATSAYWVPILAGVAVVSMTLGNVVALAQRNMKRLMGYSSIAQAGFILVGFSALIQSSATTQAFSSIAFYLFTYVFTNMGAFAVIIYFNHQLGSSDIIAYSGVAKRSPLLSFVLACCLMSLAGLPPFAGFWAKFYIFASAVSAHYTWLAVVGAVNSVVSLYYYVYVIKVMYFGQAEDESHLPARPALTLAALIGLAGIVWLFLFPTSLVGIISSSVKIGL